MRNISVALSLCVFACSAPSHRVSADLYTEPTNSTDETGDPADAPKDTEDTFGRLSLTASAASKLEVTPVGEPVVDTLELARINSAVQDITKAVAAPKKTEDQKLFGRFLASGSAPTLTIGGQQQFLSSAWKIDRDAQLGRIFARRGDDYVSGVRETSEANILAAAARELDGLGVGASERVLKYKRLMGQDRADVTTAPRLVSHKVYTFRTFGGVRVASHRMVLSFDDENTMTRAFGRWPRLAASGHKLRTTLSPEIIATRAKTELSKHGVVGKAAPVRFQYVPKALADGSVTLELTAIATVTPDEGETHNVRVAIDAY